MRTQVLVVRRTLTLLFEPQHDKPTKWHVRPANTQISPGIRPVWSESSLCAEWVDKDPRFLPVDSRRLWSDWADAQADLSLRWTHKFIFCWFCRAAAHFILQTVWKHWVNPDRWNEPEHNKTYKMTWMPSDDSDQPAHLCSLVRVFTVRMQKHSVLGYP